MKNIFEKSCLSNPPRLISSHSKGFGHFSEFPGFTLAEVLITLTIIGVIAAITIPNLMQKHQEQEFIQKLKKNYSILSNAYNLAVRENGEITEWNIGTSDTCDGATKAYQYLKPYLKVQKECGCNKGKGCFADNYKALFNVNSFWNINNDSAFYKFILSDGTAVAIWSGGSGVGFTIDVDLNNNKGPNRFGVDTFLFQSNPSAGLNGLVPAGKGSAKLIQGANQCTFNGTHSKNGATCGMHVIYKGNMDYLRRDISSEW